MSPRLTNILLGVALLACGIYAYQWHDQLQSTQANLNEVKAERDRLNQRIAELKKKPLSVDRAIPQQETEPAENIRPGRANFIPGTVDGPPMEAFRGGDGRARFMAMMDNPEIQKLMGIQQKAALDAHYAGLFRSLNLSPADLEKFKNLLVEKQTSVLDARNAARAQGLTGPENRDALRQVIANAQTEVDNTIRSALGEATFAQYQSFEQTVPERNLVAQLQQRLSYSTSPLTEAQSNQVVALLTIANQNRGNAQSTFTTGTTTRTGQALYRSSSVPITDAVIAGSINILTSTQISALTQLQQEQQAQAELTAQLRAARLASSAKTGNGSNPPALTNRP